MEVPGSTVRLGPLNLPVAGGGYFRILPYALDALGHRAPQRRTSAPAVFYLHPWEIDPGTAAASAQAGWGVSATTATCDKTERRLRTLLTDFRFGTVAALLRARGHVTSTGQLVPLTLPYVW